MLILSVIVCVGLGALMPVHSALVKNFGPVRILVDNTEQRTEYQVLRNDKVLQSVGVNHGFGENAQTTDIENGFEITGNDQTIRFETLSKQEDFTLIRVSRNVSSYQIAADCLRLNIGQDFWYGGPSLLRQEWPFDKVTLTNYSMVSKTYHGSAISERYWLNSKGVFVYIEPSTPLFVDQNVHNNNSLCLSAQSAPPYNGRRDRISLIYFIGGHKNSQLVHLEAVKRFLGKPVDIADRRMVQYPIFSTWARYKKYINEDVIEKFADEILQNDFPNSQLEIDDDWEECYGSQTFHSERFAHIASLVKRLKERGFRFTLWVHPFINKGCEPWYSEAVRSGYFVVDHYNNSYTKWWNGKAGHIDFTNSEAAEWYRQRLLKLQRDIGIDSFKFDAGEHDFAPKDARLNAPVEMHPIALTTAYLQFASQFGTIVEVRAGQNTQKLPIFVRMMDKDSKWTHKNGLATLIPALLHSNIVGYPFVLPDMIGGNGYDDKPDKELFIRWLQANVFMPTLQFSYVPWDYDQETIEISRKFTKLHSMISDHIVHQMKTTVLTGEPVNLPIWWYDPEDIVAQQIDDEFLLGSRYLVAPVIVEGAISRDIYFPKGRWIDANNGAFVEGPKWIRGYAAPLDMLPYFVRHP